MKRRLKRHRTPPWDDKYNAAGNIFTYKTTCSDVQINVVTVHGQYISEKIDEFQGFASNVYYIDCRPDRETQRSRVHTFRCVLSVTLHGAAYRRRRSDRNKVFHFFSVHCIPGTWHNIFNTNRRRVRMTILFSLLFSFNNDLYHDASTRHWRESRMTQPTYWTPLLLYHLFWREYERPQNVIQ